MYFVNKSLNIYCDQEAFIMNCRELLFVLCVFMIVLLVTYELVKYQYIGIAYYFGGGLF